MGALDSPVALRGPVGQRVRAPKTAELIASHLRGRIVRGELATGETLPSEAALLETFGVSRPTLREAFRILETESLINVRRGARGGARVVAPDIAVAARYVGLLLQVTRTTIADVYEARMVIEPAAAGLLASRRTGTDLDDLTSCVAGLAALAEGDEQVARAEAWLRATQRFGDLILERAGNQTLAVQAAVLREVVATHLRTAVLRAFDRPGTREDLRKTVRSYRKLILLLDARDAEGAQRHWRAYLEAASRALLRSGLDPTAVVDLFS
jgi:GntR family transcriptional regulator, transcriptional repressor for pyruvate dehydrogenase complex